MSTELKSVTLLPGDQVVITRGALVRLHGSEAEHWTDHMQNGIVVQKSHQTIELGVDEEWDFRGLRREELGCHYLVLFSDDSKLYMVPSDHLLVPNQEAMGLYRVVTG